MSTRIPHQLKSPQDLEDMFLALNRDIYAYIAARVRERAIAEDIAQEVFIKAWEKRRQFDPAKGSLKNWAYAIALNAVRDYFRRNTLRATVELPEEVWDTTNIESDIATAQLHTLVTEQLKHLNSKEQELLVLRYNQELSVEEIAEIMTMKYSATKVALHRATKKLQKRCNHFSS